MRPILALFVALALFVGGAAAAMAQSQDTEAPIVTASPCLGPTGSAALDCGERHIRISSNGLPSHAMMIGIADGAWNAQWPMAQNYSGSNAFLLPRVPQLAALVARLGQLHSAPAQ